MAPQAEASRFEDVTGSSITVDFRRPSNIRMFGQAFEWAGFGSYTKALPQYQGELSAPNKFTYYATSKDGGRVYFSGFNEEGFVVSNRGVEDITTGQVRPPEGIDAPVEACPFFECLRVADLTVNGDQSIGGDLGVTGDITVKDIEVKGVIDLDEGNIINSAATTNRSGIGDLASWPDIITALDAPPSPLNNATVNAAINGGDDNGKDTELVTAPALSAALKRQNFIRGIGETTIVVLHVCRDSSNILTGTDSLPFRFEEGLAWDVSGTPFQSSIFTTVTDALKRASEIYTPVGATIVISVHDDLSDGRTIHEVGPLQLLNGTALFVIAGAQGA